MRLGLQQVRGLRAEAAQRLVAARSRRPWATLADLLARVPLTPPERRALAAAGAFNALASDRRSALWSSERIQADFATTGVTTGRHPMALLRAHLAAQGILSAAELARARHGRRVTIAGSVICRQRPGTAKGVVFISLEDETGVANAIVRPELFEARREVVTLAHALRIHGRLQQHEGTTAVLAERIDPLDDPDLPAAASHDFH